MLDIETLAQLISISAESCGLEIDPVVSPRVVALAVEFERDVRTSLIAWVESRPGTLADDVDAETLVDEEGAYNILMTLRGEGVGIWDGRWDHLFADSRYIRELEAFLVERLGHYSADTGCGSLDIAFSDAAYEAASVAG